MFPVKVAIPFLIIPTSIPRISAPKKIMLQTPIITAIIMTIVRLGLRQILRQANWKYIIELFLYMDDSLHWTKSPDLEGRV